MPRQYQLISNRYEHGFPSSCSDIFGNYTQQTQWKFDKWHTDTPLWAKIKNESNCLWQLTTTAFSNCTINQRWNQTVELIIISGLCKQSNSKKKQKTKNEKTQQEKQKQCGWQNLISLSTICTCRNSNMLICICVNTTNCLINYFVVTVCSFIFSYFGQNIYVSYSILDYCYKYVNYFQGMTSTYH